ncbi:CLUMA_CG011121, isoform A [Clunio marinus]|uniref:CLUMA_CG011121, isoform A n=1 Tax=Clunio marinus TaxID=568069 RepID=A0A1J1IBT8_9DIPT|nr:CLUMA_CG011121, isoform A [Clunio marinus]
MSAKRQKTIEKLQFPAALLVGLVDDQLIHYDKVHDQKELEIHCTAEYINFFQNEILKLNSQQEYSKALHEKQISSNIKDAEETEKSIEVLEKTYKTLYSMHLNSLRYSHGMKEVIEAKQNYLTSFGSRHNDYQKIKTMVDFHVNRIQSNASKSDFSGLTKEYVEVENTLAELESEGRQLNEKVSEKRKLQAETAEKLLQEITQIDEEIQKKQKILDMSEEINLQNEILDLETKLKVSDNCDSDSSAASVSSQKSDGIPKIAKISADFSNFFKNPNDFPSLKNILSPNLKRKAVKEVPKQQQQSEKTLKHLKRKSPRKENFPCIKTFDEIEPKKKISRIQTMPLNKNLSKEEMEKENSSDKQIEESSGPRNHSCDPQHKQKSIEIQRTDSGRETECLFTEDSRNPVEDGKQNEKVKTITTSENTNEIQKEMSESIEVEQIQVSNNDSEEVNETSNAIEPKEDEEPPLKGILREQNSFVFNTTSSDNHSEGDDDLFNFEKEFGENFSTGGDDFNISFGSGGGSIGDDGINDKENSGFDFFNDSPKKTSSKKKGNQNSLF